MKKPKFSIGQNCFFILFWGNEGEPVTDFTVNSGNVRAIEYDSEIDDYVYHVDSPFVIDFVPEWMRRLLPVRFRVCRVIRSIYHHFNRKFTHDFREFEVFHDIRDAVEHGRDYMTVMTESGSSGTGSLDPSLSLAGQGTCPR